uniref:Uncharacterized protein n=1 Tax=Eutreptiella gymnastica TaxID=73025 RepID=A0A7S4FU95_9EUGL
MGAPHCPDSGIAFPVLNPTPSPPPIRVPALWSLTAPPTTPSFGPRCALVRVCANTGNFARGCLISRTGPIPFSLRFSSQGSHHLPPPGALQWGTPIRLATSVCQLRHDQMEQGPTEPHAGRSTFLSPGGAGGGYY